jgi:hypothetical protein
MRPNGVVPAENCPLSGLVSEEPFSWRIEEQMSLKEPVAGLVGYGCIHASASDGRRVLFQFARDDHGLESLWPEAAVAQDACRQHIELKRHAESLFDESIDSYGRRGIRHEPSLAELRTARPLDFLMGVERTLAKRAAL